MTIHYLLRRKHSAKLMLINNLFNEKSTGNAIHFERQMTRASEAVVLQTEPKYQYSSYSLQISALSFL